MKKVFTLAFLLLGGFFCGAQNDNCFGIIVGKNASATGEVILGHNEDDGGEQMLNIYAGPEYIWAEFPMNWSVLCIWHPSVRSPACRS